MSDNISKMDFKQLRNQVQLLSDQLAIMKRKYEDIIYNLDDDNFSSRFVKEKGEMRTAIEINAEGIKTKVSKEDLDNSLSNYSTISQTAEQITTAVVSINNSTDEKLKNYSTVSQTAQAIATEVSTLADADYELSSRISQTSSEIRSIVSKNISVKFESTVKPTYSNTTDAEKGMLCEYNGTLYYFNDVTETWKVYPYADGISSQFLQTSSGFELTGDVSISGDAIVGGTITGVSLINSGNTTKLVLGADSGSTVGDLNLKSISGNGTETTVFSVYDHLPGISLKSYGNAFLFSSGSTTYPQGTWDFSECDSIVGIGTGGGSAVAVFG